VSHAYEEERYQGPVIQERQGLPAEAARMLAVKSFAEIPAEVRRRVAAGERVVLILLDAFGLEFLERHRDHP
jgi:hypothetical protein